MNLLRRIYECLVDVVTGTDLIELELTAEEREQLEELARRIGLTPSQYLQAIAAKYLLDHQDEVAEALASQKSAAPDVSS